MKNFPVALQLTRCGYGVGGGAVRGGVRVGVEVAVRVGVRMGVNKVGLQQQDGVGVFLSKGLCSSTSSEMPTGSFLFTQQSSCEATSLNWAWFPWKLKAYQTLNRVWIWHACCCFKACIELSFLYTAHSPTVTAEIEIKASPHLSSSFNILPSYTLCDDHDITCCQRQSMLLWLKCASGRCHNLTIISLRPGPQESEAELRGSEGSGKFWKVLEGGWDDDQGCLYHIIYPEYSQVQNSKPTLRDANLPLFLYSPHKPIRIATYN